MNTAEKISFSEAQHVIYEMMTSNTGTHILDSGTAYGRNWERNQSKSIDDFANEPSATLDVGIYEYQGQLRADIIPTVSVFHKLGAVLEIDSLCRQFNAMPCDDWNSDIYGVSHDGYCWLQDQGFDLSQDAWNTYNWQNNFSQVLQGQNLELDGENYVLIQVHGGCDVRGGYTDAKLFKLDDWQEPWAVVTDDCMFADLEGELYLDWRGEWIDSEGSCADDEYLLAFARACGAVPGEDSVTINGHISES